MGDIANQTMSAIEGKVAVAIKRYWKVLAGEDAPLLPDEQYKKKAKELIDGKMKLPGGDVLDVAQFRTKIKDVSKANGLPEDMAKSLSELDNIPTKDQAKKLSEAVERGAEKGSSFTSSIGGFFAQIMNYVMGFFSGLMDYFSKDNKKSFGECISSAIGARVSQTVGISVYQEVSKLDFVKPHQAKEIAVAAMQKTRDTADGKQGGDLDQELRSTVVDQDFHKNIQPKIQEMIRVRVEEGFAVERKDEKGKLLPSGEETLKSTLAKAQGISTKEAEERTKVIKKTISDVTYRVISDKNAPTDPGALKEKLKTEIANQLAKDDPYAKDIVGKTKSVFVSNGVAAQFVDALDDKTIGLLTSAGALARGDGVARAVNGLPQVAMGQRLVVDNNRHDATGGAPSTPGHEAAQAGGRKK